MRAVLKVSGMTCVNCAKAIEVSLKKLKGVQEVHVSFELGRVVVEFNEELLDLESIKQVIESLGYKVESAKGKEKNLEVLLFCWFASISIMILMLWHTPYSLPLQAILSLLVQAFGGYTFYKGAISSIKVRVGNMDLLVALGSTASLLYSFLSFFKILPGEPFFETSAFLITFVKTGKFLEEWVKSKALKSLRDLFALQTIKVKVLKDGKEELKSPQEVFIGDVILLRSGDMVPLDCKLIEGSLEVDESLISGESLPVKKSVGDKLISGSLVVSGFAKAKVEKGFSSSYANLLVKLVEESLSKKPSLQRLADRFSHYFVQFVVAVSFLAFLLWYLKTGDLRLSVNFSLAVLVVSCPCAFGIAVPLALVMGLLRCYRKGVLVKNPAVFERQVDIVVLDKTGTLTEGKPQLVDIKLYDETALKLACGLAVASNHPYSIAIRQYCQQKGVSPIELQECKEEPGTGIYSNGLFLGRSEEGHVALKEGNRLLAEFFFEDKLREEAKEVVSYLKRKGIKLFMLTGDKKEKAIKIAKELNIDQFLAEAKPEDKLKVVEELQSKGYRVAVVGDGINDAPAMAKADLSVAIGSGTDLAKRVGDVILLKGLKGLMDFFELKDKTIRRVKENLFWAFFYNTLSIPLAGGLLYSKGFYLKPELAGLLMALSSLSVVLNSVRK
jgi:Cu2+-exporting ATPase/Cu+-exporting ATPase